MNVDIFRGSLFSSFIGQTVLMSANQSKQGYQKVCIWPCHQALGERAMFGPVTGKQGSHPQKIESWERENSELTKLYGEAWFSAVNRFLKHKTVFWFFVFKLLLFSGHSGLRWSPILSLSYNRKESSAKRKVKRQSNTEMLGLRL